MTSAIEARIMHKQADRAYLDANKRSNLLCFDMTNNLLLYCVSGTEYVEFEPGTTSGTSAYFIRTENPIISILNGETSSTTIPNISAASKFPFWSVGYRNRKINVIGPTSGSYQATIILNGALNSDLSWDSNNEISATISNSSNTFSNFYLNKFTKWAGYLVVTSGSVPFPGISATIDC